VVLEKEGVPAIVIGTDEFQALATLESKARGLPDLSIALTQHPIGGLRPHLVVDKAKAMVDETVRAITAAPEPAPVGK
jgi:hypothetical protein